MDSSNEPSSNGDDGDRFNILKFSLWVSVFFVQVWAWERFLPLQPEQARNYNMWRPYALVVEGWIIPKFYNEKEQWAIIKGQNLEQELESFI
ncbi:hypothetical protein HAX54_030894 [Datura stramonium]|uniref:Uncharacterized protein n=1 Tax=Datura stramonium TaxID=4076 RepID=A0ABS8V8R0_DATST|nr:hypothetical protein [Datura stramonium]